MIGLLKNEIIRFLKSKKNYLIIGVVLGLQIVLLIQILMKQSAQQVNSYNFLLNQISIIAQFMPILLAIYIADAVTEEFRLTTIKMNLVKPISRVKFVLTKSISATLFALLIIVLMIIFGFILSTVFLKPMNGLIYNQFVYNGWSAYLVILKACGLFSIAILGVVSLITFIAFISKNTAVTIASSLGLFMISQIIDTQVKVQHFSITYYVNHISQKVFTLSHLNIVIIGAYIVIFGILTMIIFRRDDMV